MGLEKRDQEQAGLLHVLAMTLCSGQVTEHLSGTLRPVALDSSRPNPTPVDSLAFSLVCPGDLQTMVHA